MDVHKERLCAALEIAMSVANSEIAQAKELIGQKPLPGVSQENHDAFFRQCIIESQQVHDWLKHQLRTHRTD